MSFTTPKKQQKQKDEMEKKMKRDAEVEVLEKDADACEMHVGAVAQNTRHDPRSTKTWRPEPEHQKRLIKKAAKILKKTFKHDRDVFGVYEEHIKYSYSRRSTVYR